ncbi:MAG: hypothetical protein LBR54_02460 [Oscillospiraceae bacterium]|jgi:hypothetical protein|nr:hypothetical protein [Oscillospiraceae bacterium]
MNINDCEKLKKGIEIIEEFLKEFEGKKVNFAGDYCHRFKNIFYQNGGLDEFFVHLFPDEKLNDFSKTLDSLTSSNSNIVNGNLQAGTLGSDNYNMEMDKLKEMLNDMKTVLTDFRNTEDVRNIFVYYSCESHLKDSTNCSFIEDALSEVIEKTKNELGVSIELDKDTGDAIKALTDERVIRVFNEASGSVKNLPFDIKSKRRIKFDFSGNISQEDKNKEIKEKFINEVYNAIKLINENE